LVAFFCYVCFLVSCIYVRVLCKLACCFDGASLLLLLKSFSKSHCTMERRQDGLRANRGRKRGQRGHNPPWYCHYPNCRRGFARPHVFRRGHANSLCNVRLRVLRQEPAASRSASGDYSCIARVGSHLACCTVNSRTPPVAFPRTFCCVTVHPLLERWFSESKGHGFLSELQRVAVCSCFTGTPLP